MPSVMPTLLPLLLLAAAGPSLARECERMKVPFCEKMPYTETRLPNVYNMTSQGEVNMALEPLQVLQDSGCFGHYSFVLCSALAPPCLNGYSGTPAPCRHVCEKAQDHCFPLMLMFNITDAWLDCDVLPDEQQNPMCMTPTSITPRDNCHCLKKNMPVGSIKDVLNNKDYDYAMKARMEGFAPSQFPSVLSVTVLEIFRDGIVELPKNNITFIRTNTSCKCPELKLGEEYLIMGHEDFNKSELLLGKDSYVVPYTERTDQEFGVAAVEQYRDPERRTYSSGYRSYVHHHGYHLGFHRPSFSNLLMLGGAYALYRHYSNKKKLGKVYGYPGYGGFGSSFGTLGGGGFGALGNPRGKYTNYGNYGGFGSPNSVGTGYGYGYNPYGGVGGYGRPAGSQVPSYPVTHKPNYATSKPNFINRNPNPSYPVTNKPSRSSSSRGRSSRNRSSSRWGSRSSRSSRSRWGGRYRDPDYGYETVRTTSRPIYHAPPPTRRTSYPATQRPSYPATRRPSYPATRRPSYPVTQRSRYSGSSRSRYSGSSRRSSSSRSSRRFG